MFVYHLLCSLSTSSFPASASFSLFLASLIFTPFSSSKPLTLFSVVSFSSASFSLPSLALSLPPLFFFFPSIWLSGTFGSPQPPCSPLLPLCTAIQLSSHMPVFQFWQTLISTQQRGMLSWCKLVQKAPSNPGSEQSLERLALSKDNSRSKADSCSVLHCRYLPGSKIFPFLSSLFICPFRSFEDGGSTNV